MKKLGILYIVSTPIGNLEDITLRAIKILSQVDIIAAEDTRHSRGLLDHLGIQKKLISLHEHNETARVNECIENLKKGLSIAVISDAGTPLIHDPGYRLVKEAHAEGIQVVPVPGVCAAIAALSVSGLPTNRFLFEGFLPAKASQRRLYLKALSQEPRTLVFYEAPHRVLACFDDFIAVFGVDRNAVIARELTKKFESIYTGTLQQLKERLMTSPEAIKGEFVLLLEGSQATPHEKSTIDAEAVLSILLSELPVKQAAHLAAKITGEKKNKLYAKAVKGK